MMKLILSVCGLLALTIAQAETNVGIVYGHDGDTTTNHGTNTLYTIWAAGTEAGPFLGYFDFVEFPLPPGLATTPTFHATRILSFTGYREILFGKVADMWFEGLFDGDSRGGSRVIARFRLTDPDYPVESLSLFTLDIYSPNNMTTPIYSRLGVANDGVSIMIRDDAGWLNGGSNASSNGMAWSTGITMTTNRFDTATACYRVTSNGIVDFNYKDPHIAFRGARLKSFQCCNNGFAGKEADIWLTGYSGSCPSATYTPRVAHIIITASASAVGLEFIYIALYDPVNLSTPVYERLGYRQVGGNNVLCK
jgi:hypothetical protein